MILNFLSHRPLWEYLFPDMNKNVYTLSSHPKAMECRLRTSAVRSISWQGERWALVSPGPIRGKEKRLGRTIVQADVSTGKGWWQDKPCEKHNIALRFSLPHPFSSSIHIPGRGRRLCMGLLLWEVSMVVIQLEGIWHQGLLSPLPPNFFVRGIKKEDVELCGGGQRSWGESLS